MTSQLLSRPKKNERCFDVLIAASVALVCAPVAAVVALLVRATSDGPVIYRSDRIGADFSSFEMLKFRTMKVETPALATHLLPEPEECLTPVGGFLRRTSLDEIPQFVNVLKGDMSIIGPRPALFNQDDLMDLRREAGVHRLRPGVTGLAQTQGRDTLTLREKVRLEKLYLETKSLSVDTRIILDTVNQIFRPSDVKH